MYTVVIAVGLNIVVPMLAKSHIPASDAHPAEGVESLNTLGQILNQVSLHARAPVSTSIVVAIFAGGALVLALYAMKKHGASLPSV